MVAENGVVLIALSVRYYVEAVVLWWQSGGCASTPSRGCIIQKDLAYRAQQHSLAVGTSEVLQTRHQQKLRQFLNVPSIYVRAVVVQVGVFEQPKCE